jgi:SOS regulatory protein LexA
MPAMRLQTYFQQILTFYRQHHRMPSYREIGAVTGLRSTNAVFKVVNKMRQQGLIAKDARGRLLPKQRLSELRFVGLVEAGFPSPADDELFETMNLEQYLVRKPEATYLLRVQGESMIEAGIMPGDLVLVERGAEPHDGEIVIAQIDGEWTLKYFRRKGNQVYLEPANGRFQPFYAKEELKIAAVVTAVIRKY